jgi:hypothetical protein
MKRSKRIVLRKDVLEIVPDDEAAQLRGHLHQVVGARAAENAATCPSFLQLSLRLLTASSRRVSLALVTPSRRRPRFCPSLA